MLVNWGDVNGCFFVCKVNVKRTLLLGYARGNGGRGSRLCKKAKKSRVKEQNRDGEGAKKIGSGRHGSGVCAQGTQTLYTSNIFLYLCIWK